MNEEDDDDTDAPMGEEVARLLRQVILTITFHQSFEFFVLMGLGYLDLEFLF